MCVCVHNSVGCRYVTFLRGRECKREGLVDGLVKGESSGVGLLQGGDSGWCD